MEITTNHRYPGSRPFQDTKLDRMLFKGREEETKYLFQLVLAKSLVVLYAKSGMGKSSLLHAGLFEPLRKENYLPISLRFNNRPQDIFASFYEGIQNAIRQWNSKSDAAYSIDYVEGEKETLWQYFKTVQFWAGEKLLTPVLILDQFEEVFTLQSREDRLKFFLQLADVVRGRVPKELRNRESFAYSEKKPEVRFIISIREDFLGYMEEMAVEIPTVLNDRFRLTPLSRQAARQAIVEPAQMEDETIHTQPFSYSPDAIEEMLNFLSRKKAGKSFEITEEIEPSPLQIIFNNIKNSVRALVNFRRQKAEESFIFTDNFEPFQLQLLCHHIEANVVARNTAKDANYRVKKEELGGLEGMSLILEDFYKNQINSLGSVWKKRRVRKLCEKFLISETDRRLSIVEETIERKYKVHRSLLNKLVNNRLLRSEPRTESIYYELSHDTLVEPIRKFQKRAARTKTIVLCLVAANVSIICLFNLITLRDRQYTLEKMELSNALEQRINELDAIISYQKTRIVNQDNTITAQKKKIGNLSKQQNIVINQHNTMGDIQNLRKVENRISQLENTISQLKNTISEQQNTISEQQDTIYFQEKIIKTQEDTIKELSEKNIGL